MDTPTHLQGTLPAGNQRARVGPAPPSTLIEWRGDAVDANERRVWAQELVGVLLGLPQPKASAPVALRSLRDHQLSQTSKPLSYRELRDRYSSDGLSRQAALKKGASDPEASDPGPSSDSHARHNADGLVSTSSASTDRDGGASASEGEEPIAGPSAERSGGRGQQPANYDSPSHWRRRRQRRRQESTRVTSEKPAGADVPGAQAGYERRAAALPAVDQRAPVSRPTQSGLILSRPGTGGRQLRANPVAGTIATAELVESLGEPERRTVNGATVLIWNGDQAPEDNGILYPDGDGCLAGRLSSRDLQQGETAMGQAHSLLMLADNLELRPFSLLLSLNNSGAQEFERRRESDFGHIESGIREGRYRWVAWRSCDRIGREVLPVELFYDLLKRTKTDLYLCSLGRKVDWSADRIQLLALGMVGEQELMMIRERTHSALRRRWLEEGRGWPTSIRFGFKRNPVTKFLEVDPEQWEWVRRIHYEYGDYVEKGRNGADTASVRRLCRALAEDGCPCSETMVKSILSNPMFVTGEWSVTYKDERIACRPIELADPIPADIFERNQQLLRQRRGRQTVTPLGTHVLNRVPLYHARCMDLEPPPESGYSRYMLRTRGYGSGRQAHLVPVYAHTSPVPECCRGYTLDARALEAAVIGALRELALSPELQKAWTEAASFRVADRAPIISAQQEADLQSKLANLERQEERLTREFMDRLSNGEELGHGDHDELLAAVRRERSSLRRRLEVAAASRLHHEKEERRRKLAAGDGEGADEAEPDQLKARLLEVLSPEPPEDAELRLRRAAFVESALSKVVIHDVEGDDLERVEQGRSKGGKASGGGGRKTKFRPIKIELFGPLVPEDQPALGPFDPLDWSGDALTGELQEARQDGVSGQLEPVDEAGEEVPAEAGESAGGDSQTGSQVCTWSPVCEHRKPSNQGIGRRQAIIDGRLHGDPTIEALSPVVGTADAVINIFRQLRRAERTTGRPAWRSPLIEVELRAKIQPTLLSYRAAIEVLMAAMASPTLRPRRSHNSHVRAAYEAWRDSDDARREFADSGSIGAATGLPAFGLLIGVAKRSGIHPTEMIRQAEAHFTLRLPAPESADILDPRAEQYLALGRPFGAGERKDADRVSGDERQADASAAPVRDPEAGEATGDIPPATASSADPDLLWRVEYDRVLAVLMELADRLPAKQPFGPKGYAGICAKDARLPPYAHILFTARRNATTPLLLLAEARRRLDRGIEPPKPLDDEARRAAGYLTAEEHLRLGGSDSGRGEGDVTRKGSAERGSDPAEADYPLPRNGAEALALALRLPRTTANGRGWLSTWGLKECVDALSEALPEMTRGQELGRGSGSYTAARTRNPQANWPTDVSMSKVAHSWGLSAGQLVAAVRGAVVSADDESTDGPA